MGLWLDWVVITVYCGTLVYIGWRTARRKSSIEDYFLAKREMHWSIISISFIATSISALSFVGAPEQGFFETDWYIYSNLGDLIARFIVAFLFLSAFYKLRVQTIYELLGKRFGLPTQRLAAGYFLVTRIVSEAIRITAATIVLNVVVGGALPFATVVIVYMVLVLAYVLFGGLRAVMWSEIMQFFVFMFGLVFCFLVIVHKLPGGWSDMFRAGKDAQVMALVSQDKLLDDTRIAHLREERGEDFRWPLRKHRVIARAPAEKFADNPGDRGCLVDIFESSVGPDGRPTGRYAPKKVNKFGALSLLQGKELGMLLLMIVWGIFGSTAAYGCDHDMAQRLLTADKPRKAKKAMIVSGFLNIPMVFLFLFIGIALYAYNRHTGFAARLLEAGRLETGTHVFAGFIFQELPAGVRGLLVAGILAAAMSTSSAGLNSLSSSVMIDFYKPLFRKRKEDHYVFVARCVMVIIAVINTIVAVYFGGMGDLLWMAFKIVAFSYGALLGIFLLAMLLPRGNNVGNLIAMISTPIMVGLLFWLHSVYGAEPPSGGVWDSVPFLAKCVKLLADIDWRLYVTITAIWTFGFAALFRAKRTFSIWQ